MSSYDDAQVMVTLAALSYLDPTANGSPHDTPQERIFGALTTALGDTTLATQGEWIVSWLGLTTDEANLAYIVEHSTEDTIAVVVRGTVFALTIAGLEDIYEDLRVGALADFTVGDNTVEVSYGAHTAFDALQDAVFDVPGYALSGLSLADAVAQLTGDGATTIYVTGHSLGGCLTTMVALDLRAALAQGVVQVYTYAAPTAGLEEFAALFDDTFSAGSPNEDSSWRVVNAWDVIPTAWETLDDVLAQDWYPPPGPARDWETWGILKTLLLLPGSNAYIQPSTNVVELNTATYGTPGSHYDADSVDPDLFKDQVLFQHSLVESYMPLLGAPVPPPSSDPAGSAGTLTLAEPGRVHVLAISGEAAS